MMVMPHVSRPLVALLLATVVFFAVWMVALKPKSDTGSSGNSAPLQSAVDKAHAAVAQSNAASAAHGGTVATTPTTSTPAAHPATTPPNTATTPAHAATTPAHTATAPATAATTNTAATKSTIATIRGTAAQREAVVVKALRTHKTIALLFFNFRAADDRAIKKELSLVPTHGGKVVKEAVPLAELARYKVVTQQVPVTMSPTLIIIDAQAKAWTILGYATEFEISQRVTDALRVKAKT
jgi:hypothetical protein